MLEVLEDEEDEFVRDLGRCRVKSSHEAPQHLALPSWRLLACCESMMVRLVVAVVVVVVVERELCVDAS